MADDAIVVFTMKGLSTILAKGGSDTWKLNPHRVLKCQYLVCTQNRHRQDGTPEAPHGAAFLVGKISGVEPAEPINGPRWLVRISEYAEIEMPDVWDGSQNPVQYTTLQKLGIDPATLDFQPMPEPSQMARERAATPAMTSIDDVRPLSIADAKQGLAAHFGVGTDAIEITIRG
jgi:hypothetical protein